MDIYLDGLIGFEIAEAYWDRWWPGHALDLFGEALEEDTRLRLEDDTKGPRGEQWAPWSDNPPGQGYASTRGPQHKLLFDSGDLSRSLDSTRRGDLLDFGSPLPYAIVHQTGSRDGRLPARPYVGVSRELGKALDNIFPADFDRGLAGL